MLKQFSKLLKLETLTNPSDLLTLILWWRHAYFELLDGIEVVARSSLDRHWSVEYFHWFILQNVHLFAYQN